MVFGLHAGEDGNITIMRDLLYDMQDFWNKVYDHYTCHDPIKENWPKQIHMLYLVATQTWCLKTLWGYNTQQLKSLE